MAGSPPWKVYDAERRYRASTAGIVEAAVLVSFLGDRATIRNGHNKRDVVWTEGAGHDGAAGESYDHVCDVVEGRRAARQEAARRTLLDYDRAEPARQERARAAAVLECSEDEEG